MCREGGVDARADFLPVHGQDPVALAQHVPGHRGDRSTWITIASPDRRRKLTRAFGDGVVSSGRNAAAASPATVLTASAAKKTRAIVARSRPATDTQARNAPASAMPASDSETCGRVAASSRRAATAVAQSASAPQRPTCCARRRRQQQGGNRHEGAEHRHVLQVGHCPGSSNRARQEHEEDERDHPDEGLVDAAEEAHRTPPAAAARPLPPPARRLLRSRRGRGAAELLGLLAAATRQDQRAREGQEQREDERCSRR